MGAPTVPFIGPGRERSRRKGDGHWRLSGF
jgi:hypothetical protein